jgi:sodium transport system permease protein
MNLREIWLLYRHELRSALRERAIVVNSILVPLLLYPVMLWGGLSAATLVQGLSEGFTSRVAIYGLPTAHLAIRDTLAGMATVELVSAPPATVEAAEAAVRERELDAVLVFEPAPGAAAALPGNFVVRVTYDQSEDRSRRARERVGGVLDRYRSAWLEREVEALDIAAERLVQFEVERQNVASEREMGAFLLSLFIPLLLVIMVALGCFYPAIDSTAGERERSTWETLMTVSASRTSVLMAKYLYVATFGIVAGLLNVVAMLITIGALLGPLLGDAAARVEVTIPAAAVPVMALGAIALALLFAALMMILASFARTFKEGQAMIMPVYYAAILPVFFVMEPDIGLDVQMAAIPVANVMLMIKEAFQGTFQWLYIGQTLLVSLALVAASLALARWILGFEELLLGSYDGNFWKFIKERARRKEPARA